MSEDTSAHEVAVGWARVLRSRLRRSLRKKNVGQSFGLFSSIATEVVAASGGDVEKILLFYRMYGAFRDMGVGRGQKIGDVKGAGQARSLEKALHGSGRGYKRKAWYSGVIFGETAKLGELMAKHYGTFEIARVMDELPKEIHLKI